MDKVQRRINIIMLLIFSAYALYTVMYQNSSTFFVVYLFWFDEVIRNISAYIQVKMHVENVKENREFTKKDALIVIKTRFFFLFVYSVFIIVVFGLFFHLSKDTSDQLVQNVRIFFFRDIAFNICLMIAVIREILQIRLVKLNRYTPIQSFGAMSGHLLTLHLSIIFGGVLWALTSGKFADFNFKLNLGPLQPYAIILPFFIIKFLVDLYAINHNRSEKTLIDTLQK